MPVGPETSVAAVVVALFELLQVVGVARTGHFGLLLWLGLLFDRNARTVFLQALDVFEVKFAYLLHSRQVGCNLALAFLFLALV